MEMEEKHSSDITKSYISQINWDYLFFKAQTIFGLLLLLGFIGFAFWMV